MISVFFTFVAAMLLVAGIVINQNKVPLDEILPEQDEQQVLSEETETSEQPEKIDRPDNKVGVEVQEDDSEIDIRITDTPENDRSSQGISLQQFIYPQATVVTRNESTVVLDSTTNTETLTNWYKEQLESQDMNINTFVSTQTNGNVENELVSSNGGTEIRIKILKDGDDNVARIEVTIS